MHNTKKRDGFNNRWGFIFASIGSAVGMGNIWRFPVMISKFGGLTFLIPYIIFVVLVASTGVISEISFGRLASAGPIGAFGLATKERFGKQKPGEVIGAIPIIGALMLAIGYTVVLSWIFKYCFMGISGKLFGLGESMDAIAGAFGQTAPEAGTIGEAIKMMIDNKIFSIGNGLWIVIALVFSLVIMALGVSKGIEKANKIMMPALFILFVLLGIYVATLDGADQGYKYIFTLNPKGLLNPEVWIFAFGQAFFSLSVAGNGSIIYGSYLSKEEAVPSSAVNIAFFDTLAAVLAALVIIPAMAAGGAELSQGGPGLMFVYLVKVFNGMVGGRIVGMVFFICVLFAGLSSIVNLYEVPIALLQEKFNSSRTASVIIIGIIGALAALLIQPWTSQWMDIVSIYICPLGAFLAGAMFYYVLSKDTALKAVNEGSAKPIGKWFIPLGKYGYVLLTLAALILGALFGGIG